MPSSGGPDTQLKKTTTVESTAPLAANGVFQGSWHDSQMDGTVFVTATVFSNVAGSSNALLIQESDDITNNSFTRQVSTGGLVNANTIGRTQASIKARFWRIIYTNGALQQTTVEITTCAMNAVPLPSNSISAGEVGIPAAISINANSLLQADNVSAVANIPNINGQTNGPTAAMQMWGGAFSGTADTVRQFWSKARTPTVFKQVTASALNATVVWTPGTNNKFRLLKYRIIADASAIMAAATDLTIKLLDAAADIGQVYIVRIPAAALASGVNYDSGWVDLGTFGILSAAAGNALNVNLSAALTSGLINVLVAGVEE